MMEIEVEGLPPYKQAPADNKEKESQKKYVKELKTRIPVPAPPLGPQFMGKLRMEITYTRIKGRADSANIIGGIADALQGILYKNDKQIVEIRYDQRAVPHAIKDEYTVKIEPIDRY